MERRRADKEAPMVVVLLDGCGHGLLSLRSYVCLLISCPMQLSLFGFVRLAEKASISYGARLFQNICALLLLFVVPVSQFWYLHVCFAPALAASFSFPRDHIGLLRFPLLLLTVYCHYTGFRLLRGQRNYQWTEIRQCFLQIILELQIALLTLIGLCFLVRTNAIIQLHRRHQQNYSTIEFRSALCQEMGKCCIDICCAPLKLVVFLCHWRWNYYTARDAKATTSYKIQKIIVIEEFLGTVMDIPYFFTSFVLISSTFFRLIPFCQGLFECENPNDRRRVCINFAFFAICDFPAMLCWAFVKCTIFRNALLSQLLQKNKLLGGSSWHRCCFQCAGLVIVDITTAIFSLPLLLTVYKIPLVWVAIKERKTEMTQFKIASSSANSSSSSDYCCEATVDSNAEETNQVNTPAPQQFDAFNFSEHLLLIKSSCLVILEIPCFILGLFVCLCAWRTRYFINKVKLINASKKEDSSCLTVCFSNEARFCFVEFLECCCDIPFVIMGIFSLLNPFRFSAVLGIFVFPQTAESSVYSEEDSRTWLIFRMQLFIHFVYCIADVLSGFAFALLSVTVYRGYRVHRRYNEVKQYVDNSAVAQYEKVDRPIDTESEQDFHEAKDQLDERVRTTADDSQQFLFDFRACFTFFHECVFEQTRALLCDLCFWIIGIIACVLPWRAYMLGYSMYRNYKYFHLMDGDDLIVLNRLSCVKHFRGMVLDFPMLFCAVILFICSPERFRNSYQSNKKTQSLENQRSTGNPYICVTHSSIWSEISQLFGTISKLKQIYSSVDEKIKNMVIHRGGTHAGNGNEKNWLQHLVGVEKKVIWHFLFEDKGMSKVPCAFIGFLYFCSSRLLNYSPIHSLFLLYTLYVVPIVSILARLVVLHHEKPLVYPTLNDKKKLLCYFIFHGWLLLVDLVGGIGYSLIWPFRGFFNPEIQIDICMLAKINPRCSTKCLRWMLNFVLGMLCYTCLLIATLCLWRLKSVYRIFKVVNKAFFSRKLDPATNIPNYSILLILQQSFLCAMFTILDPFLLLTVTLSCINPSFRSAAITRLKNIFHHCVDDDLTFVRSNSVSEDKSNSKHDKKHENNLKNEMKDRKIYISEYFRLMWDSIRCIGLLFFWSAIFILLGLSSLTLYRFPLLKRIWHGGIATNKTVVIIKWTLLHLLLTLFELCYLPFYLVHIFVFRYIICLPDVNIGSCTSKIMVSVSSYSHVYLRHILEDIYQEKSGMAFNNILSKVGYLCLQLLWTNIQTFCLGCGVISSLLVTVFWTCRLVLQRYRIFQKQLVDSEQDGTLINSQILFNKWLLSYCLYFYCQMPMQSALTVKNSTGVIRDCAVNFGALSFAVLFSLLWCPLRLRWLFHELKHLSNGYSNQDELREVMLNKKKVIWSWIKSILMLRDVKLIIKVVCSGCWWWKRHKLVYLLKQCPKHFISNLQQQNEQKKLLEFCDNSAKNIWTICLICTVFVWRIPSLVRRIFLTYKQFLGAYGINILNNHVVSIRFGDYLFRHVIMDEFAFGFQNICEFFQLVFICATLIRLPHFILQLLHLLWFNFKTPLPFVKCTWNCFKRFFNSEMEAKENVCKFCLLPEEILMYHITPYFSHPQNFIALTSTCQTIYSSYSAKNGFWGVLYRVHFLKTMDVTAEQQIYTRLSYRVYSVRELYMKEHLKGKYYVKSRQTFRSLVDIEFGHALLNVPAFLLLPLKVCGYVSYPIDVYLNFRVSSFNWTRSVSSTWLHAFASMFSPLPYRNSLKSLSCPSSGYSFAHVHRRGIRNFLQILPMVYVNECSIALSVVNLVTICGLSFGVPLWINMFRGVSSSSSTKQSLNKLGASIIVWMYMWTQIHILLLPFKTNFGALSLFQTLNMRPWTENIYMNSNDWKLIVHTLTDFVKQNALWRAFLHLKEIFLVQILLAIATWEFQSIAWIQKYLILKLLSVISTLLHYFNFSVASKSYPEEISPCGGDFPYFAYAMWAYICFLGGRNTCFLLLQLLQQLKFFQNNDMIASNNSTWSILIDIYLTPFKLIYGLLWLFLQIMLNITKFCIHLISFTSLCGKKCIQSVHGYNEELLCICCQYCFQLGGICGEVILLVPLVISWILWPFLISFYFFEKPLKILLMAGSILLSFYYVIRARVIVLQTWNQK